MKNTLTKVLTIIAIALVGLIAASAVTLAIVKSNFNQVIDTDKVTGITVYTDTQSDYFTKDNNKEVYNKLVELYNKGTKESVISALFQGAYSENAKAEVLSTSKSISALQKPDTNNYVLQFYFSEDQTLVVNGETVTDSSIYGTDKSVKYSTVFFEVEENTTLTKVNCYIVSNTSSNYCYRYVSFVTAHADLHEYISELELVG